jgi:polyketide biosynthesis acyl carrier protein
MTREDAMNVIINNIFDILPELEGTEIQESDSLLALGANSIDRADIIMSTLEDLQVKMPMIAFGEAKNIGEIVTIIVEG